MQEQLNRFGDPRVFVTDPEDPEEGRVFVWALTRWYERVSDEETGAVEFPHLFDTDKELDDWLQVEEKINPDDLVEMDEGDDFGRLVREEFLNQTPLYPEAPELSDEVPEVAERSEEAYELEQVVSGGEESELEDGGRDESKTEEAA